MSTFLVWVGIIIVVFILLILLRKFIKRLIFIVVLLGIAFFIYGLFSPSGAEKLWYYVKTFPQKIVSLVWDETYLSYEEFQLTLPSIEHPEIITSPLDSSFSGTESPKQEGNPPVSQLLNKIQSVLQPATSSSISVQPSLWESVESIESVWESVDSSSQPLGGSSESIESIESAWESVEIPSQPIQNPSVSKPVQQTVNGLTVQEIREAEALFEMLLWT